MTPDRLKTLVAEAADLPRDRRDDFLQQQCNGDVSLLAEARSLLLALSSAENAGFMSDPPPPADFLPNFSKPAPLSEGPGTIIGRYKILQSIGEGGFGSVFM